MRKRVSSFVFDRRLVVQFMILNGVVIFVMAFTAIVFMGYFTHNYNSMLNSQLSTILEISADSVQKTVDDIERTSLDFMASDDVQSKFSKRSSGDRYTYEDFLESNALKKSILDLANNQTAIKFAVLLDADYMPVVSAMGINPSWTENMSLIVKSSMGEGERYKWIAPTDGLNSLVAVRRVADLSDPELPNVGAVVIGINIESIVNKTSALEEYPFHSLIAAGDDIIYTDLDDADTARQLINTAEGEDADRIETELNGIKYYKSNKELDIPGWRYMVYASQEDILGGLRRVVNICVILFILAAVLMVFISYKAAKRMTRPAVQLSVQMKKVENGVFEGVELDTESSENELYSLAADFNVMVERIDTLIKDNYLKKILLQENELKLLQSQINPHFLYNTLESVHWMAKSGRTDEISVMVQALSRLFRAAVNNKDFLITLKEELDLLGNYITIQKIRFESRLEIHIDVDEEFYGYRLPKLILQPLVENSIKYALEEYQKACVISIYSERSGDGMRLYVADNGPGIEQERLERIRNDLPIESRSGIALKNIRRRMEMTFGSADSMEIESAEGEGTTVILNIPSEAKKISA